MRKKIFISLALIVFTAAVLLILIPSKKGDAVNPNLMIAPKTFVFPEDADDRFEKEVEDNNLGKTFLHETVNTLYPSTEAKWIGRIKYSGVSYHSLFAVDNSSIRFKLKKHQVRELKGLTFSIFNPGNTRMFYKVFLESGNEETILFKGFYDKETFLPASVDFPRTFDEDLELVFETQGKGIGAWLNPRLDIPRKKPNIVIVIVLDTVRYDHTSLYGYSRKTTPVLETLSRDAVVFRNAYSTTSWTLPAHVSLFSGKTLDKHGVTTPNDTIPLAFPLVSEVFQKNGYVTAAFTGGGFIEDTFGFFRGFQLYSNNPGSVFSMNSAERVFDHFKNYIEQFKGNDLFIFLHTYQAHAPYKAPHEYIDRIAPGVDSNLKGIKNFIGGNHEYFKSIDPGNRQLLIDLYDSAILYCDEMLVGSVVNHLKQEGMYEDAMLIVLSDHGEEFYDHHSWEHGHTLYRELVQIPLLIKYPRNRKTGKEETLVSIADLPGIMLRESHLLDNQPFFQYRVGEEKRVLPVLLPVSPIIHEFPPKVSFVDDQYHFIFNILDKEKIAFFDPLPPVLRDIELYEKKDYLERTNLSGKKGTAVDRFGKLLSIYLKQVKGVKSETFKLNKELEEKLKSLGYLGGK
jgi:choline-sulfatase